MTLEEPSEAASKLYGQPSVIRDRRYRILFLVLVIAVAGVLALPWINAHRLSWRLGRAESISQVKSIARELISAESQPARLVLANFADQSKRRAYDPFHNVLAVADINDAWSDEHCHVIRDHGGASFGKEGISYVEVTIVENVPECVTFALRRSNGRTTLLLVAYKSIIPVRVEAPDKLSEWRATGFWNKYVQDWGDPNWERSKWSEQKKKEYEEWLSF